MQEHLSYRWSLLIVAAAVFSVFVTMPVQAQLGGQEFCVNASTVGVTAGTVSPTTSTCTDSGNSIVINAVPAPGASFESWSLPNDCYFSSGYYNTAKTRVTCTAGALPYPKYTVYASFGTLTTTSSTTSSVPTTTVSAEFCANATLYQPSTGGTAYPSAYVCVTAGDSVSISAVPASGYTFSSWFLPSGCSYASGYGNSASTQVTCAAGTSPYPKYIMAVGFTPVTTTSTPTTTIQSSSFCVNATVSQGNGTIYPQFYNCASSGQSAYISATPGKGSSFYGWRLPSGCSYVNGWGNSPSTYVTCAAGPSGYTPKYTASAQFYSTSQPEFCVKAALYSTRAGAGVYPVNYECEFAGQGVAISISPPSGFVFGSWSLPSGCTFASGYGNTASTQVVCNASPSFPTYTVYGSFSSTFSPVTATVVLSRGWDLFSVPLTNTTVIGNTCPSGSLLSPIWQFTNGTYSMATKIHGGLGYWVQASTPCTLTFSGQPLTTGKLPYLSPGWNLIGALNYSTSFTSILGSCNVVNGPLGFDIGTNQYYNASQIATNSGYFVDVSSGCTLGVSGPPPPP